MSGHCNDTGYIVRHIRRLYTTARTACGEYSGNVLLLSAFHCHRYMLASCHALENLCVINTNSPSSKCNAKLQLAVHERGIINHPDTGRRLSPGHPEGRQGEVGYRYGILLLATDAARRPDLNVVLCGDMEQQQLNYLRFNQNSLRMLTLFWARRMTDIAPIDVCSILCI